MSGVATQKYVMTRMITCKEDLHGELLTASLTESCKGLTVSQYLKEGNETVPNRLSAKVLWNFVLQLYKNLPDEGRTPTTSSESNSSFTAEDLRETFTKLTQNLVDTLPDLVAPKVSKLLETKQPSPDSVRSLSDCARTPPLTPVKRYISIRDKDSDGTTPMCEKKWTDVVKPKVETALKNIPVLDLSVNKKRTHLHFETDDQLEQAKEVLSPFLEVSTFVEKEKKKDPRIMINDLDPDLLEKDVLLSEILSDKNEGVKRLTEEGHQVKVVHVNQSGRYAVVQVSPEVRKVIAERKDRLFLKLRQHMVKNRFYVTQCYHCQRFGHVAGSIYCPNKDKEAVCSFCSGEHDTRQCPAKKNNDISKMKCANCDHSGSKEDKRHAKSHPASSNLCPFYVNAKARLMDTTSGVAAEEKNVYLTRAREDLRRKRLGRLAH